jgi:hypothetical protein
VARDPDDLEHDRDEEEDRQDTKDRPWAEVDPDDPYLGNQETNVDLQLREGDNVLASVTTVLDVDQEHEAHELAREVQAALESGEANLTASSIERYADRLR